MDIIRFTKAEAAQNDFILVEDFDRVITQEERTSFAVEACHRRRGIGADGVIFFERSAGRDFTMVFHNPDGSTGSMCGNGGRAAAMYAFTRGLAPAEMRFDVLGVEYRAIVAGGTVTIYFPPPREMREVTVQTALAIRQPLHFVHTGAPHLVVPVDALDDSRSDIETLDMQTLGSVLRWSAEFQPNGVNVNVITRLDEGMLRVRTFEKGVEAETMACGTGTIASAIVAQKIFGLVSPLRLRTQGGDVLVVGFGGDGKYEGLFLEGPARLVFAGEWQSGGLAGKKNG